MFREALSEIRSEADIALARSRPLSRRYT